MRAQSADYMNEASIANEVKIARNSLAAGDFALAAFHVHRVFDLDPLEADGLELADFLVARAS
jgi:hypothetical protein